MNVSDALAHAKEQLLFIESSSPDAEREKNEAAIKVLLDAWNSADPKNLPFPNCDVIRDLADRNRDLCDSYPAGELERMRASNLPRGLSDSDLVRGVAALQGRRASAVKRSAGEGLVNLDSAYIEEPVKAVVCGVDIETTDRCPDRGYIINVGLQIMELAPNAVAEKGYVAYCGLPSLYKERGVPLTRIHQITWPDLEGKTPFRQNRDLQKALLETFKRYPYMAHNAAFEDAWFMLHLDGYAEARKAGKITPVDTRDICKRLDPEYKSLPRETSPGSLENWSRRRGTLQPDEKERHLGLDDVDLMFRTVIAEFKARNMFR